jgi:peroxisomal coenzyme A diphosphatase NUDT7
MSSFHRSNDEIFSQEWNSQVERLQRVLSAPAGDRPNHDASESSRRRASVLVPLLLMTEFEPHADDADPDSQNGPRKLSLHVLLTERSKQLKSHPGEVCFPGGKQDENETDVDTAFRETKEEIGIDVLAELDPNHRSAANQAQLLGTLPPIISRHGLLVTPVVAFLPALTPSEPVSEIQQRQTLAEQLIVNKDEVERVFTVPLEFFLERNNHVLEKVNIPWYNNTEFCLRTYIFRGHSVANLLHFGRGTNLETFQIWGLTACIAHQVACLAIDGTWTERLTRQTADDEQSKNDASRELFTPTSVPNAIPDATGNRQSSNDVLREGYLYRWNSESGRLCDKGYWSRFYYVLTSDCILHQYLNEQQSKAKSLGATKKNRIRIKTLGHGDDKSRLNTATVTELQTLEPTNDGSRASASTRMQTNSFFPFEISLVDGRIIWTLATTESSYEARLWAEALSQG